MKKVPPVPFFKVSLVIAGLTFFMLAIAIISLIVWFKTAEITSQQIFFRSWESKTIHGEAVYNQVKYFKQPSQEIWMMNQSHHGYSAPSEKWDRLAIVIKNRVAQFYQLPAGPLQWSNDLPLQKIDLKVDCRQCHNNGPRAVRSAPDFKTLLTNQETLTIFLMNLRIKFYGHLENNLWMRDEILPEKIYEKLNFQTCLFCHNGGSKPWNRSLLTWQQKQTIGFLLENNQMPPPGFTLSEDEKEKMSRNLHNL